tara:strand:- start:2635 stop:2826 length:192 start_codon:yes stop_codon:yes gene_type:complete
MKLHTNEEIQKDVKKAQQEFSEICTSSAYYLNTNGMKIDAIRTILHRSLDECINNAESLRDGK